jgi:hypothetical protein
MRIAAILMLLSMILVAGCGEDEGAAEAQGSTSVQDVAVQIAQAAVAGDWNAVYAQLHPAQQSAVGQDLFVQCRSTLTIPQDQVTSTFVGLDAQIAPNIFDQDAFAVTLQFAKESYETITDTVHLYTGEDNGYYWYMNQSSMDDFVAGRCDVDPQLASDFALQLANAEIAGDWAAVYDMLHPNQKAVVPRDLFIECRSTDVVRATGAEVVGVFTETISVPEVPDTESYAVTLALTFPDQTVQNMTLHIYEIDTGFAWVLGDESIAAFSAGQCD